MIYIGLRERERERERIGQTGSSKKCQTEWGRESMRINIKRSARSSNKSGVEQQQQ